MLTNNSKRVSSLKNRVLEAKNKMPGLSPMKIIAEYPRLKSKYILIKNVLALKSTDSLITNKIEEFVNKYNQ